MEKFVELPRVKKEGDVQEKLWLEKCRKERLPFITVTTRVKLADVHWDYITLPTALDSVLDDLRESTLQGAREIFLKYADGRSQYEIGSGLVWFRDLEIPAARLAAQELFDFLTAQLREPLAELS